MGQLAHAFEHNGVQEHFDASNHDDMPNYLESFDYDLFLDQPYVALPAHTENTLPPIYTNEYQRWFAEGFPQQSQQEEPACGTPSSATSTEPQISQNDIGILPRLTYQRVPDPCEQVRPQVQGMKDFQNPILNSFVDPYTPLRIIDEVAFPFHYNIEEALQQGLQAASEEQPAASPDEQQSLVALPSISTLLDDEAPSEKEVATPQTARSAAIPIAMPLPPRLISTTAKIPCNKRTFNIASLDPSKFYTPLSTTPSSWGGPDPVNAPYFTYISNGEFAPTFTFTMETFTHYLAFHPLHSSSPTAKTLTTKTSPLQLWIQTAPADSGKRYKSTSSGRCRFTCCPRKERTIYKGEFRIALDELTALNPKHDPFVNAGYVHLFCLEKFFDFPSICKSFNVQPDTRNLPEGKNKMAITRDHASMQDICLEFIDHSLPWIEFGTDGERVKEGGVRPQRYYEWSLCYKLNVEHLKRQPRRLQAVREKRGGNTVDLHLGDLDVWVGNREVIEERKRRDKRVARAEEEARINEEKKRMGKKRGGAGEDGSSKRCKSG